MWRWCGLSPSKETEENTIIMATGKIVQVQGPVVDVEFEPGQLPKILNAVRIPRAAGGGRVAVNTTSDTPEATDSDLVVEVAQHLGNDVVRCIAMSSTDGLVRGEAAYDTGSPISVPVGPQTLGRVFNLLGRPIDERGPVSGGQTYPIHRAAPSFEDLATKAEVLETGVKVIDLLCPYLKGGKIGLFGGAGSRQDGYDAGADPQHRRSALGRFRVRRCR